MENKKQNRIEIFNEMTIMFCSHLYNIFLRGEGQIEFINYVGWSFIGASAFNILVNMAIVVIETLIDIGSNIYSFVKERKK